MHWLHFIKYRNLVTESRFHLYLHSNCDHQIVFVKLNLNIKYCALHESVIWVYKNVNVQLTTVQSKVLTSTLQKMKFSIKDFFSKCDQIRIFCPVQEKLFDGWDVQDQSYLCKEIIFNKFHNFIPDKIFLCNEQDPTWLNDQAQQTPDKRSK